MKPAEIRQMTPPEVEQLLADKDEELSNLRLQAVTQQLDNPLLIRRARRDMAQLKTALRAHELGILPLAGGGRADSNAQEPKES